MKIKNKTKGFTLIELMVVISIIALLSSVVLAGIVSAREKAQITKTVGEMKSLQNAIELFRSDKGYYPDTNEGNGDAGITYFEDYNDGVNYMSTNYFGAGEFNGVVQTYLVNNKYISKVPASPNYPNNCEPYSVDCIDKGYFLGYSTERPSFDNLNYYMCGDNVVNNYAIFFYANSKKINLPILKRVQNGVLNENDIFTEVPGRYTYCLSM